MKRKDLLNSLTRFSLAIILIAGMGLSAFAQSAGLNYQAAYKSDAAVTAVEWFMDGTTYTATTFTDVEGVVNAVICNNVNFTTLQPGDVVYVKMTFDDATEIVATQALNAVPFAEKAMNVVWNNETKKLTVNGEVVALNLTDFDAIVANTITAKNSLVVNGTANPTSEDYTAGALRIPYGGLYVNKNIALDGSLYAINGTLKANSAEVVSLKLGNDMVQYVTNVYPVENATWDLTQTIPTVAALENLKSVLESEISNMNGLLDNYYTMGQVNTLLEGYVTTATLDDYYTAVQVDDLLAGYVTVGALDNYYTKDEVDGKLTDLTNYVDDNFVTNATFNALEGRVTTAEGEIDNLQSGLANLTNTVGGIDLQYAYNRGNDITVNGLGLVVTDAGDMTAGNGAVEGITGAVKGALGYKDENSTTYAGYFYGDAKFTNAGGRNVTITNGNITAVSGNITQTLTVGNDNASGTILTVKGESYFAGDVRTAANLYASNLYAGENGTDYSFYANRDEANFIKPVTFTESAPVTFNATISGTGVYTNVADIPTVEDNKLVSATAVKNITNILQENIDAEATARIAADNTLQENIDAEATARIAADENLQDQISAIDGRLTTVEGDLTTLTGVVEGIDLQYAYDRGNTIVLDDGAKAAGETKTLNIVGGNISDGKAAFYVEGTLDGASASIISAEADNGLNSVAAYLGARSTSLVNPANFDYAGVLGATKTVYAALGAIVDGTPYGVYSVGNAKINGQTVTNQLQVTAKANFNGEVYANTGVYFPNAQLINDVASSVADAATVYFPTNAIATASYLQEVQGLLTTEINRVEYESKQRDTILQKNIDAEAAARILADDTLQANIDAEAAARILADDTLQANIDAEAAARIAADKELQNQIDTFDLQDAYNRGNKIELAKDKPFMVLGGDLTAGQTAIYVDGDITNANTSILTANTTDFQAVIAGNDGTQKAAVAGRYAPAGTMEIKGALGYYKAANDNAAVYGARKSGVFGALGYYGSASTEYAVYGQGNALITGGLTVDNLYSNTTVNTQDLNIRRHLYFNIEPTEYVTGIAGDNTSWPLDPAFGTDPKKPNFKRVAQTASDKWLATAYYVNENIDSLMSFYGRRFETDSLFVNKHIQDNGTLTVEGATTLNDILDVDGATTLNSTLDVTGATALASTLDVTGATALASTLDVTGATELASTLDVTGATALASTLNVDGATTLGSTLNVTDATILGGTLAVTGVTALASTLDVDGATTLGSTLDVTDATKLGGTLDVTDATTLGGTLDVTGATALASTLEVTGATALASTLGVDGATTLGSTLDVTDATILGGTLAVTGVTTLADALTVAGATQINNTLAVTGDATLDTLYANYADIDILKAIIFGADTIKAKVVLTDSLGVTKDATIGGTLGVTGATTLDELFAGVTKVSNLTATGNAAIGGTLGVTGKTTLDELEAGATKVTSLDVIADATIGGKLTVIDSATFGNAYFDSVSTHFAAVGKLAVAKIESDSIIATSMIADTLDAKVVRAAVKTTTKDLDVTQNAAITGTLDVTAATTLAATSATSLTVSGSTTLQSTGIQTANIQNLQLNGGQMVTSILAAMPTTVGPTQLLTANAIKTYVDDTVGKVKIALADTAVALRNDLATKAALVDTAAAIRTALVDTAAAIRTVVNTKASKTYVDEIPLTFTYFANISVASDPTVPTHADVTNKLQMYETSGVTRVVYATIIYYNSTTSNHISLYYKYTWNGTDWTTIAPVAF